LTYLRDPAPPEGTGPLSFVLDMRQPRPYQVWCKELVDVTKEVFWIFLHHLNVVSLPSTSGTAEPKAVEKTPPPDSALATDKPLPPGPQMTTSFSRPFHQTPETPPQPRPYATANELSYTTRHFPRERPPVPAAPYVGGVEWDATNYLAAHLDLLNALLASLPMRSDRNNVRRLLRDSGFEKCMGGSLRTCKEKFYGAVHCALRTWVAAAAEDGWDVRDVRFGPRVEEQVARSVKSSPAKKKDLAPRLNVEVEGRGTSPLGGRLGLKLELGGEEEMLKGGKGVDGDGWAFEL
jgi:hypothetical protein